MLLTLPMRRSVGGLLAVTHLEVTYRRAERLHLVIEDTGLFPVSDPILQPFTIRGWENAPTTLRAQANNPAFAASLLATPEATALLACLQREPQFRLDTAQMALPLPERFLLTYTVPGVIGDSDRLLAMLETASEALVLLGATPV